MELVIFLVLLALLGLLGFWFYRNSRRKTLAVRMTAPEPDDSAYQVSFAPPEFEWSGDSSSTLRIKTLTYKQYECLEDARYGFKIIAVTPPERKKVQPRGTRAHGLKTVTSLAKHGFLADDGQAGYLITDLGLNALEVCSVRY
ncbi:MAG: hypothetical protein H7228_14270 [Polaromonas sp.]|nr:hypothetical protein [Polaromonas sp.]